MRKRKSLISFFSALVILPMIGCSSFGIATQRPTATLPPPFIITTPTPTITPTPEPPKVQCGGPEVMYLLIVGTDTRGNSYSTGLADATRLVRVDFINPSVMILAFQRDLYVDIPGISQHYNITHGKLNQAYLYGTDTFKYYDGPGKGLGLLSETLKYNFGAQVDHSAAINLQTFVKVVDALGGIDINLPKVIDGRVKGSYDSNLYFASGEQHLNGYRTMLLARLRPVGDLDRNHTQDLILQALAKKLLNPTTLLKVPELIDAFKGSVQTDLDQTEITQLLCLAALLQPEKIQTVSFPDELFKTKRVNDPILGNTSVLDVDFNILKAYVQDFNNGTWPDTIPQP